MIGRIWARVWHWASVLNFRTGWRMSRANRFMYRATRGLVGGRVPGAPVVLLTTTGRRSGRAFTVPLAAMRERDDLVVATFAGTSPRDPDWYHNLLADPNATVQHKGERFPVRAAVIEGDERERIVRELVRPVPLADLQYEHTPRRVTFFRLTRA